MLWSAVSCCVASCAGDPAGDTLVVLPDTQFYACAYPDIFEDQTSWLAEQASALGVSLVVHTGDIVDDVGDESQWEVAADSLSVLDGQVPYMVTVGNHDIFLDRSTPATDFIDPPLFRGMTTERFDDLRSDTAYSVVYIGGEKWLIIGLEYAPRDAVIEWADVILDEHRDLPAIVFTHAYLHSDGTRFDRARVPPQPYHPDNSGLPVEDGVNDGEDLWRKLIEPHENVRIVLSGHVIPDGTARSVAVRDSGTRVHQVLANYQLCAYCPCAEVEGGGGYLRLMKFDSASRRFEVSTYSPYLDEWLEDDENHFVLELE